MQQGVLIFAGLSALLGGIFFVSLVELIFTVHRRKTIEKLNELIKEMRTHYNQSINRLVVVGDAKLDSADTQIKEVNGSLEAEKAELEKTFQSKIDDITAKSEKELESAKGRAKKLQQKAKEEAADYLKERKAEVEEELMNLVISVSKKVLPEGITYDAHKDLVMQALRDVKTEEKV